MNEIWSISGDLVDSLIAAVATATQQGVERERVFDLISQRIESNLNATLTPRALAYCVMRIAEGAS